MADANSLLRRRLLNPQLNAVLFLAVTLALIACSAWTDEPRSSAAGNPHPVLQAIIVRRIAARPNAEARNTAILIANAGKTDIFVSKDIEAVNVYKNGVCIVHHDYGTDSPRRFVCLKPGHAIVKEDISVSDEQWKIMSQGDLIKLVVRVRNKEGGLELESLLYDES